MPEYSDFEKYYKKRLELQIKNLVELYNKKYLIKK
jgi:hypothetical protein